MRSGRAAGGVFFLAWGAGLAIGAACVPAMGQEALGEGSWDGAWRHVDRLGNVPGERWVTPRRFGTFRADMEKLGVLLASAPLEVTREGVEAPLMIAIPMPDGGFASFDVVESPVMEPALAARFPEIRTYVGQGLDDPDATIRLDLTPQGFHAQVLSPSGRVMVDPLIRGGRELYASYYASDNVARGVWECFGAFGDVDNVPPRGGHTSRFGETLRVYRLANAATGEYTQYHGGTVQLGMAAITTAINRVTGVYEQEVAVRLTLVANNSSIVYTNGSTDPFTNNNGGSMLGQNQSTCDSVIGSANYDIGHVFSTGGGGVAYLGVACRSGQKAGGVTGLPAPTGDNFYIDYVAHEMGHQFGANHSFNSSTGSCGGNRSGSHAYEPGSGSTIMSYAGICGSDNIQSHSDAYMTSDSFEAIRSYTNSGSGNNCPQKPSTGNAGPTVSAGSAYSIPAKTPFTLSASGSDPNGDPLTFCWEERDLGPAATLTTPDDGQIPLNRSYTGTSDPTRTVPRLATILANTTDKKDRLPDVARSYVWRVTGRDNRAGGGGVGTSEVTLNVVGTAGPFDVTSPAGGAVWEGTGTVTWNVANTTASPINCSSVNILLSTNGGQTFPTVLASGTPNDGTQVVSLPPDISSVQARIKVQSANNIFFDINPANFTVEFTPALQISLPDGAPTTLTPGQAALFDVLIEDGSEQVEPGSERLYVSYDGGSFVASALTSLGGGLYSATLPAASCDDDPRFYIEAMGDGGTTVRLPEGAPGAFLSAAVGTYELVSTDNFETNTGWSVSGNASGGQWDREVPGAFGFGDPDADADASGRCWVTGNTILENVNGGTTTLTSPAFDLSAGGRLSYSYWLDGFPGSPLGPGDGLFVDVATDAGGTNWTQVRGYTTDAEVWRADSIDIGVETPASATVRIRFRAIDSNPDDTVEAGLDAFGVSAFVCEDEGCQADFNNDGSVNTIDVLAFLNAWASGSSAADINGDGSVNTLDVIAYLNLWTAGC